MKLLSRLCLIASFALALQSPSLSATTEAIVLHHATLRSDPSSQHRPILVLESGEDVEVLDSTPTHNYYHVRTADGVDGWIYSRNLQIVTTSNAGPASNPVTSTPQAPESTSFSPNWDKPVPAGTTFEGPDGECGPTGDSGDSFTNLRKNRTDVPQNYHEVTWKALQSLPYPVAGRSLEQWTSQQTAVIIPYEDVPVSVTGYLVAIKVEDSGSGESTNCHFVNPEEVDWHMPFVEHPGDGEDTAVVVETTPRVRKSHPKWTTTNLAPWVNSQAPIRISGWTLLDPEHRAHLGRYRSTLWEIHPVLRIEVFKSGQWVDIDNLP